MRALFTLTKRQIVDNAVYFLAAIIFSVVLIIAIISITLSEDITYLSLYTVSVIVITPILFGIGSYILGVIQTYSDKTSGVTTVLSVLPITHGRIFLARLIIGILIILTLLGPLAITGIILWKLLGPPDWLFHSWLGDTFIGLSLTSPACYCLGLIAARRADTFVSALKAVPLVPILMLLIIIKGFGWPLLAVLLPLLAFLLLCCWKKDSNRFMTIIATGFIALALLAIPLYIGRNFCNGLLVTKMAASAKISPSGLLSMEIENDPNVQEQSEILAKTDLPQRMQNCPICNLLDSCNLLSSDNFQATHYLLEKSGIIKYFLSRKRGKHSTDSTGISASRSIHTIHLDVVEGQLIQRRRSSYKPAYRSTWRWDNVVTTYAGPEGVSSDPNNTGQFSSPIVFFEPDSLLPWRISPHICIVFDRDSRRFYLVDFARKITREGPIIEDPSIEPYETGLLPLWELYSPAEFRLASTKSYRVRLPIETIQGTIYLPIISKSGRIDVLDLRTPKIIGPVGQLPKPRTLFGTGSSKPRDLLDYDVDVVSVIPAPLRLDSDKAKVGIIGILAVSVSRQGLWTSVAVFDKDGKKIKSADSKSTLFNVPGGPALTITKYIFESLHPPVLTLASYFTAYSFDARSAHRALFLMPNSFVAMARDYEGNIFYMILIVSLLMLPGIMFAALLGWRVEHDAAIIGLSNKARRFWLAGTLAFGLAGYITYRLSRPKVTLVTCANCGRPRRPDMDKCHRCGSKWNVPELTPPAWRVLNGDTVDGDKEIRIPAR